MTARPKRTLLHWVAASKAMGPAPACGDVEGVERH